MLQKFFEVSQQFLKIKNSPYRRYFIKRERLKHRMSIIAGQRGVGKTTTLVQLLLEKVGGDRFDPRILYIQADHFIMGEASLYEIAEQFQLHGGKWLAIDEIHKYPSWSKELKSIYDTFIELQIFVSGSSALEIYQGSHDLVRRSARYLMQGLSFREYLELTHAVSLEPLFLEDICTGHQALSDSILKRLGKKILPEFTNYLKFGFYPYFFELQDKDVYRMTLEQNYHAIIESDLAAIYPHLNGNSTKKIKQLLMFIANSVPFVPSWSKILQILEVGDLRTLKAYFSHLESACLVRSLSKASQKMAKIEAVDKVYLDNTNQLFAIASKDPEIGTVRETFFLSMLQEAHEISLPLKGDFLVDKKLHFEVGGKNKGYDQIKDEKKAYIAADDIEIGIGNKIPLWLFGFLY